MITDLVKNIGQVKLKRLLLRAEPIFSKDYQDLLEQIKKKDSPQIISCAHSLKNTAVLFNCHELIGYLAQIEQGEVSIIEQYDLQQQLEQACLTCLKSIQALSKGST